MPPPAAMPIAATSHRPAAVVSPRMVMPGAQDRACAQESDARDDGGRDARGVDPHQIAGGVVLEEDEACRHDHEGRRGQRDDGVRAHAGGAAVEIALEADGRAEARAEEDPEQQLEVDVHS